MTVHTRFDVRRPVRELSLARRQLVEVAKALSLDARILVMDEPTSALTERETGTLFATIRRLTARGVAVVYISHRLDEIFEIGDRVTVLRDGRRIATRDVGGADRRELVRLMADREVDEQVPRNPVPPGDEVLRVEGLSRRGELHDVSFALRAGEIDPLIALRDRTGLVAAEAFMVTHHPQWIRARELVREGAIGRLRQVQGAFSFFNDDPGNIRNRADMGGGALRDIGVYPSISARFVSGEEPVSVPWAAIEWDQGIDATARAVAEFPSFSMDFYVSMRMAPRQVMTFHGDKGWLAVHAPYLPQFAEMVPS